MELTQEQLDMIRKIAYPMVSYLKLLGNPNLKVIIEDDSVEVMEALDLIKETADPS